MHDERVGKAADYWDRNVQIRDGVVPEYVIHWLNSPLVGKYCLNKLSVGDEVMSAQEWLPWVKKKYLTRSRECGLSLGCGDGALERHAVTLALCDRFDAFDASPRSISIAAAEAEKQGLTKKINYQVADVNSISLEKGKYDVVFVGSAMHHFSHLEHVTEEIRKSLKPDGLLIINEFVGPSQFQWTDRQLEIMNDLLGLLPPRLRHDVTTNSEKAPIGRPSIEAMNALDPSEAIRSAEIIPVLQRSFDVIEKVDIGGTLLHLLLYGIIDNFDETKEEDVSILRLLGYLEDILIRDGVLGNDFTCMILRPKLGKKGLMGGLSAMFAAAKDTR